MKNRKSPRWANWDYSTEGYYFVTAVTKDRIHYFGEIDNSDDNNVDVGNENPVVGNRHACSLRRDDGRRTEIFYPMKLNEYGKIVLECWNGLPDHYPDCILDEFVIMPNHIHGIIIVTRNNRNRRVQACLHPTVTTMTTEIKRNNERIPAMVGSFKSAVTNKIRKTGLLNFQWQKSFHDRIIRDEVELYNVRNYIRNNPRNWYQDELKEAA
ncbi:MAG: hypothetical protein IPL26_29865 [Leptospiraceae bacterium]|nr:hypothetical protein [Leptospiraceae bacterium]